MADVLTETGLKGPLSDSLEVSSSSVKTRVAAVTALTSAGVLGRAAFQHVPSVEPLLAFVIASGFYFGSRYGAASGASGFFASNFLVWGGQGPWTVFQCLGAAAGGYIAGKFGKRSESNFLYFGSLIAGLAAFEIIVNLGSLAFMPMAGFNPLMYLAASVPFAGIHLISTLGFGGVINGFSKYIEDFR